jgi:hypothetical protein
MMQYPLLRVRYHWQDRPGAFLNVFDSISEALSKESPPIQLENCSISYARLQVASGRIAVGHLTIRIHAPAQEEKDWNPIRTEQMGRKVSALAALKAASVRDSGFQEDNLAPLENPVIRIDLISKMPGENRSYYDGH